MSIACISSPFDELSLYSKTFQAMGKLCFIQYLSTADLGTVALGISFSSIEDGVGVE